MIQQPLRLQRKRTKGFKMVGDNGLPSYYVGRPGPFGNPLKLIADCIYIDGSHRRGLASEWIFLVPGNAWLLQQVYRAMLTDTFDKLPFRLDAKIMLDVNHWIKKMQELDLEELRGNNLFCFCECTEESFCHADVLLELSNKPRL